MRTKSVLLFGFIAILVTIIGFALFSVSTPEAQESVPSQPVETASVLQPLVPSIQRRIILFIGPMKRTNVDFETETFASPVSIFDSSGERTVLYYQDFSLNVAGQIKGTELVRSNNQEWIAVNPVDSLVEISIGDKSVSLDEGDVLMFNLSGQDPHPSIVMEIWRDGLFAKQNMNVFFEESSYEPVQRIPNWILDILSA